MLAILNLVRIIVYTLVTRKYIIRITTTTAEFREILYNRNGYHLALDGVAEPAASTCSRRWLADGGWQQTVAGGLVDGGGVRLVAAGE